LVDDHFVIFKINSVNQVEAVQIPLNLITRLEQCVTETAPRNEALGPVRELGAATFSILRLLFLPIDEPSENMESIIDRCALAVQALCLAMLSFSQAHIGRIDPFFLEHHLSEVILGGAYESLMRMLTGYLTTSGQHYCQLVNLTCAGDMIDSKVMVFAERSVDSDKKFDLSIAPEDLLSLWGPGTFIPCPSLGSEAISSAEWLSGIAIQDGIIYKPSTYSPQMHWKANTAYDVREGVPFELNLKAKMTIGAIWVRNSCPTKPGPHDTVLRTNIGNEVEELGTWPEKWTLREIQAGFQGGQFLNSTFNATWIKSDSRTRKQQGLKKVDLDFLNQPWGVLVSVCTGIAQRVALREVVAEVLSPMMDAWMEKTPEWQTLLSAGVLLELKEHTFRDWFKTLELDVQRALARFVDHTLHKICWTGVNNAGKLVVACPQFGDAGACIHVPLKCSQAFAWILKDNEGSATFACLTNTCFFGESLVNRCQRASHPQWRNHIPALITSVCQYQWSGADDWTKLPRKDLQNGSVCWMGTGEDKRRVTIETQTMGPTKLTISNRSTHWKFFRRAWERIERVRQIPHIELRERRLMTEDHTQDVVIVRDLET
jgi:hypothetical protein